MGCKLRFLHIEWAFLRNAKLVSATMLCLQALEQNSPLTLAEIPVDLVGSFHFTREIIDLT